MNVYLRQNGVKKKVGGLSFMQTKQCAAVMDAIGRLIPQEGVDYETEIIFNGANNSSVSMNITSLTEKGEWWKDYVMSMIGKYPPKMENPEEAIVDENEKKPDENPDAVEKEVLDAEVVS